MSIERFHDDPKLTAYALGELDEAERKGIEEHLARDEAAREAVAAIRSTAGQLSAELEKETGAGLSGAQREAIKRQLQAPRRTPDGPTIRPRSRRPVWIKAAAAAMVMLGFSSGLYFGLAPADRTVERRAHVSGKRFAAAEYSYRRAGPEAVEGTMGNPKTGYVIKTPQEARSKKVYVATGKMTLGYRVATTPRAHDGTGRNSFQLNNTGMVYQQDRGKASSEHLRPYDPRNPAVSVSKNQRPLPAQYKKFRKEIERIEATLKHIQTQTVEHNTETYDRITANPFIRVRSDPLSTFSIDVDTASYANVRRFLNRGALPPKDAVRVEELINYFPYDYAPPEAGGENPFSVHVEIAAAPWAPEHRLVRIGLKGREIPWEKRPASNLVFLLDVSGSMDQPNKLPLVKRAMKMLVEKLGENDRVAIVVYAGASGLVLPSTTCDRKAKVLGALERLRAGGSTNGGAGIELAYDAATQHFIRGGANRVILCTDGDFNVGLTGPGRLIRLIEEKAKSGVFLSVLGFGMGNYKDSTLEKLADKGNGNYGYIDSEREARKLLVEQAVGTLITIAKDVKIQVEFNPAEAAAYRLIGYENRLLAHRDFNDDTKDAGEIGAGHTVTALYEVVPAAGGGKLDVPAAPKLGTMRYQKRSTLTRTAKKSGELLTVKLRYKQPGGKESKLIEQPVRDAGKSFGQTSRDYRFATAVASFGMLLRNSAYRGPVNWDFVLELAEEAQGKDQEGYRAEFIGLVRKVKALKRQRP